MRALAAERTLQDRRVLDALAVVPRHRFVPEAMVPFAYDDEPLPIGEGQTISQPYVVAWMTEALCLAAGDRVLEIGTGSGYGAAVLAQLAGEVWSVECVPTLAAHATAVLAELGYANVHVVHGDGSLGWPPEAPYDAISVTAAGPVVPRPLIDQLVDGGRLVMPVGPEGGTQELVRLTKQDDGCIREVLGAVRFVPLVGALGVRSAVVRHR